MPILQVFIQYLTHQVYPDGQETTNLMFNKKLSLLNQLQLISKKANDFYKVNIDAATGSDENV